MKKLKLIPLTKKELDKLRGGITVEQIHYMVIHGYVPDEQIATWGNIQVEDVNIDYVWFDWGVYEGKWIMHIKEV